MARELSLGASLLAMDTHLPADLAFILRGDPWTLADVAAVSVNEGGQDPASVAERLGLTADDVQTAALDALRGSRLDPDLPLHARFEAETADMFNLDTLNP